MQQGEEEDAYPHEDMSNEISYWRVGTEQDIHIGTSVLPVDTTNSHLD
jgi:hypothetical protein